MRAKYMVAGVVLGVLLSSAVVVLAGNLDPTSGPTDAASQMYTLEQIYNRLNDGTTGNKMTSFTEPASGPGTGTMHTLDQVYDLIGERAPVPKTGSGDIPGYTEYAGEDSLLQRGVGWPKPRFSDNGDGTITDNLTGLIWLKNASCLAFPTDDARLTNDRTWNDALTAATGLATGHCLLSDGSSAGDWRLPNVRELQSLIHYGANGPAVPNTAGTGQWEEEDPFVGLWSQFYWSSTTNMSVESHAWGVVMDNGQVLRDSKGVEHYVWPVRGGQ